jgi:hypothetical protein
VTQRGRGPRRHPNRSPVEVAREIHALRRRLSGLRRELAAVSRDTALPFITQPSLRRRHKLLRRRGNSLLQRRGVLGVALTEKLVGGKPAGVLGATVYVARKHPKDRLSAGDRLPTHLRDDNLRRPLDVVEVGGFERLHYPGASIGPERSVGTFGSLGCFVTRQGTQEVAAITAMHIAGRDSIDSASRPIPIFSPDPLHSTEPAPFGELSQGQTSPVDAGRIDLPPDTPLNNVLPGGREIRGWRPVLLPGDRDTPVYLFGATSGFLKGRIVEPDVQFATGLAPADALCTDIQVDHGDSGAVLVDEDGYAVGLLAGRLTGGPTWSVFSKIGPVLALLDCELAPT